MTKGIILRTCMFIIIPSVLCLNPVFVASVEDCQNCGGPGTPTSAGNLVRQPGWDCICTGAKPTIVASSETISKGGSITLRVNSGGLACPSYTWSTTSKGYTLNKTKTNNDEAVTLSCTTGNCGTNYDVYATIKVTDNCGQPADIVIRNTAGTWKSYHNHTYSCGGNNCNTCPNRVYSYKGQWRLDPVLICIGTIVDCPTIPFDVQYGDSPTFTVTTANCNGYCGEWIGANCVYDKTCTKLAGYFMSIWSCP
jgi:hypothetical protein